ncbi:NAD-dependent epimerase/dehydratase family protein [Polynucleobacter sp. AP-Sanab-80-C2]|uniref:NAD-dependent epimerase/dehydratase family protein n=1 Tax=Polynucleobacter sp. AP-Sanab-80-C2 TaxID=3108274 RepID=UPI002B238050|nr:NAD-dependent epimerase/dehydratase family protein [Polynucleobacter sp. AP-Sanab-80-C2]MEA9598531.1 NAD-dependent epimerase/dehydratase family protein [Polynucleobacter sp. AP-Sanab-80-C2]
MNNPITIDPTARILITGGTGLVGRALSRVLKENGFINIISVGSRDCDLRDSAAVSQLMTQSSPDYVYHLAARVHGIGGNARYKSDVLVENVLINTNVIEYARRAGVKKIVAMGSGCVYPELNGQEELFENQVWTGPPHPSEDSYAHSKRLMLAQLNAAREQYGLSSAFVISGNLYGPHDSFNMEEGHVIPSLIAKFHAAKRNGAPVKVWGSGVAIRDFSHADDAAHALIAILRNLEGAVNMGSGMRHPILDIVRALSEFTQVLVEWDASKPDGQLVRYYNLDRLISTGFSSRVKLADGVRSTYEWYEQNYKIVRR